MDARVKLRKIDSTAEWRTHAKRPGSILLSQLPPHLHEVLQHDAAGSVGVKIEKVDR